MEKSELYIPKTAADVRWSLAEAIGPIPKHRDPSLEQVLAVTPDITALKAYGYFIDRIRIASMAVSESDYIEVYTEIIRYSQEFVNTCLLASDSEKRYQTLAQHYLTKKNILDPILTLYHQVKYRKPSEDRDKTYLKKVLQPIVTSPTVVFNKLYGESLPKVYEPKASTRTGISGHYSRTHVGKAKHR